MKIDNSHIRLGERVKKHKFTPHKWRLTDAISPDIACFIVLTGSDTTTDKQANSYAKDTKFLLKNKNIPVYAVAYEKGDRDLRQDREAVLARHNQANPRYPYIRKVKEEDLTYVPQYIRELYAATLAPRLRVENGSKAPLSLAAQRLNMIHFITHCQGSNVLFQLEYLMKKDLTDLGYSATQQQYLLHQIHSLNISPITPIGITQTTAFKFMTLRDENVLSVNTPQTAYLTERQLDDDKPIMDISLFRPTSNEFIFAASHIYYEDKDNPATSLGGEHSFAAYTDKEDEYRSIAGDRLSLTFNLMLNWLADNAIKNQKEFSELPDIFKEKRFSFILKETLKNRYDFMCKEIKRARQHPETLTVFNKKQR